MFIDEWFDKAFYKTLPLGYRSNLTFGQICWTHAYYPHENLQFWRPVIRPGEPAKSIAREFQLVGATADAFCKSYPLEAPKLATNEEFLVVRAKRRPAVLLYSPSTELSEIASTGFPGKVSRRLALVAQVFGLSDPKTAKPVFPQSFIDRVRKMEFPELMFLPKTPGVLEVDSLLRLDEVQSVFLSHLDPTNCSLGDEVVDALKGQTQIIFGIRESNYYTILREEMLQS
jgi:hypothetical protein